MSSPGSFYFQTCHKVLGVPNTKPRDTQPHATFSQTPRGCFLPKTRRDLESATIVFMSSHQSAFLATEFKQAQSKATFASNRGLEGTVQIRAEPFPV